MLLAVNAGAVATPLEFVFTMGEPPNVPPAPEPGGAKVTGVLATRFPPASFTVACSVVAKAVLMVALWGVPAVAVMLAGAPVVFAQLKVRGETTPAADAVT